MVCLFSHGATSKQLLGTRTLGIVRTRPFFSRHGIARIWPCTRYAQVIRVSAGAGALFMNKMTDFRHLNSKSSVVGHNTLPLSILMI